MSGGREVSLLPPLPRYHMTRTMMTLTWAIAAKVVLGVVMSSARVLIANPKF